MQPVLAACAQTAAARCANACVLKALPGPPDRLPSEWAERHRAGAGKGVTTVSGLPLSVADIEALATKLKKRCGSGGTVRGGIIEIQGDHRDVIVAELIKLGWQAKRSGG